MRQSKGELEPGVGVDHVLNFLSDYSLTKEDMDSVFELTQWPSKPDPLKNVDSKTKAALTRAYNKSNIMTPYSTPGGKEKTKKKKKAEDEEDDQESDEER